MGESPALMEIKNLVVFYENAVAVNNVSLRCKKGRITGIFGSNSAGKSTLMWTLSGIIVDMKRKEEMKGGERITWFGDITFNGEEISRLKPNERAKRRMILCPERRLIFTESTVLENLKIGGYLASHDQAKTTLEYVFGLFPELKELKGRSGGFLSGGEQQMLAIGMALMTRPRLLLMDEPLLGLSPILQKDLIRAIKQIRGEGVTILVTEQFARPLLPIIDRGYVIENGIPVLSGTGPELMDNPEVRAAYFGV